MNAPLLTEEFHLLAAAPNGVQKLRELILSLAMRGKLVAQDPKDELASELLKKIKADKTKLAVAGKIKSDKSLPEVGEDEQPYSLPNGWKWIRLLEAFAAITDGDHMPPPKADSGVPFLVIGNLNDGHISFDQCRFVPPTYFEQLDWSRRPSTGDLLYTVTGSFGIVIAVTSDAPFCVQRHVAILKSVSSSPTAYLLRYLQSPASQSFSDSVATGIAQKTVTLGALRSMPVAVPPLAEQHRVVAKVDELMALCDQLEAQQTKQTEAHERLFATLLDTLTQSADAAAFANNWTRIAEHFDLLFDTPESIDKLKQVILQLAVQGKLVTVSRKEEERTQSGVLGDFVDFLNGYAFKSEWFVPRGVRLLRNVNVSHGECDWKASAHISASRLSGFERFALEEGDLVLSLDRPIINSGLKVARITKADLPCLLLQRVAKFLHDSESVDSRYLEVWLNSPTFVGVIDPGRSNGVPHISTKQISSVPFVMYPVEVQHRIVAKVDELMVVCDALAARLAAARELSSKLVAVVAEESLAVA
jgi:type I restriction enzyme S subunit